MQEKLSTHWDTDKNTPGMLTVIMFIHILHVEVLGREQMWWQRSHFYYLRKDQSLCEPSTLWLQIMALGLRGDKHDFEKPTLLSQTRVCPLFRREDSFIRKAPNLLLPEPPPSEGGHMGAPCLRQDSLQLHFTSPTGVNFQTHRITHRSQNTPRNFCSLLWSSYSCFQNFLCSAKALFTQTVPQAAAQLPHLREGLSCTPFYLIILRVFFRALTSPPTWRNLITAPSPLNV